MSRAGEEERMGEGGAPGEWGGAVTIGNNIDVMKWRGVFSRKHGQPATAESCWLGGACRAPVAPAHDLHDTVRQQGDEETHSAQEGRQWKPGHIL